MSLNLELKARIASVRDAAVVCYRLCPRGWTILNQVDTYFRTGRQRLKLRETEGCESELILYDRPTRRGARWSSYERYKSGDPVLLKKILSEVLGVQGIVKKVRMVVVHGSTRIHVDSVKGLGAYIEFETMVRRRGRDDGREIRNLMKEFRIHRKDIEGASYIDLLLARKAARALKKGK